MDTPRFARRLIRTAAALGVALVLSGCIVAPSPPGYYRPHPYRYWY